MRLCRYCRGGAVEIGLFSEESVISLSGAAAAARRAGMADLEWPSSPHLVDYLPNGPGFDAARRVAHWACDQQELPEDVRFPTSAVELLVPVPRPNKLFLLAGNYARHIEEGGRKAVERQQTFPYVFMKPASTTLTDPSRPVRLPKVSPEFIDWELELGVVIGRRAKQVAEADALSTVAGYTVINDISNRKFRPNPQRRQRDQDQFFDWLHGKWADSFCPCGPCVTSADAIRDPQDLDLELRQNGQVRQKANTGQMIFPVAAIIAFLSSFVTLEPGDIVSTGTPEGVGHTTGTYLRPGDVLEASIARIGTLVSPVVAEV